MTYDEFVGQVQHRARLASTGEAVAAIRATLTTLGERLAGGEADDLAAQLPREIAEYMLVPRGLGEPFSLDEFFSRVALEEGADLPQAVHHARSVISVVVDAVSEGEVRDVLSQLPPEYDKLFHSGSEGDLRAA